MRILHICQRDDPNIGGSLRVAEALVLEQRKLGVDAWLLFLYGPPSQIALDLAPHTVCLGLKSSRQMGRGILRLRRSIREIKPDLIHTHDGIVWPRLVYLTLRVQVVMHAHLPMDYSRYGLANLLIRRTTAAQIGISRYTIESWSRAGYPADKIHFIENGVDLERFRKAGPERKERLRRRLGLPADKKILLWVGRLHGAMKGVDRIQRIARVLPPDVTLVVVGYGPDFEVLRERNIKLLRSWKMVMPGSIYSPQDYYRAADAFLFTSHHEPFGLVLLEAAASGLPILGFPVNEGGGATELMQKLNASQVTDASFPSELKQAIDRIFEPTVVTEIARHTVESDYSWSAKAADVVNVYNKLLCRDVQLDGGVPKVLVCQHGARHRYAVPRMFHEAGMLAGLYTDSSASSLIGKGLKILGGSAPDSWKSYSRWNIRGIPRDKIYSSDYSYFYEAMQKLSGTRKQGLSLYHQRHKLLSSRMKKWGAQGAHVIYSMYHENLDFIRWAKDQGVRSMVDVFISPLTEEIMAAEAELFPAWGSRKAKEEIELDRRLWSETATLADILLCPSEWVAEGVRLCSPEAAHKVVVLPYGCSINYEGRINQPIRGRVLFAGGDPLRKGLHYLARTATQLKAAMPDLDFRVAGNLPEEVVKDPLCKDLHFLGRLDFNAMREEYLSADMLVLPALSEGFAAVVAEAMCAGCPVLVTKEAGSPVIHEREGLVVRSRDVDDLSSAVERLVNDRPFRSRCSENCLKQIDFYSESQWKNRLIAAVENVTGNVPA